MSNTYLHLAMDGCDHCLSIKTEDEIRQIAVAGGGTRYRSSPIFPVIPKEGKLPGPDDDYFVGFFCLERPFSFIGRLLGEVRRERQSGLWFSHGLASLLFFANTSEEIESIWRNHEAELRAYEIWHVAKGRASPSRLWLHPPVAIPCDMPRLSPYADFPGEVVLILDQLAVALHVATDGASQYMPDQLESLVRLVPALNDILTEMRFLLTPELAAPPAFSVRAAEVLRSDAVLRYKLLHQRTGELVQITASLNAANTQAYTGSLPLMSSSSFLVGTHSLLGIGTAHRAICKFAIFAEAVFQKYPIAAIVRDHFGSAPSVPIFPCLQNYTPTAWITDQVQQVDYYLHADMPDGSGLFNVIYYSLRIGFRESTFATTAAMQAIAFCDDARWSLMTLSHEILHAHVAEVLAAIFDAGNHDLPDECYRLYAERFREDAQGRVPETPRHLIDSLRSIILNYQAVHPQFTHLGDEAANRIDSERTEGLVEVHLRLPPLDRVLDPLNTVFHEINEVMVHVLDYHYFYYCNEELYLGLLWESWCPVPKVLNDVEDYILRSLIAIASGADKIGQDVTVRFNNSVARMKRVLQDLLAKSKANIVASQATTILDSDAGIDRLLPRFHLGVYLADMTSAFLLSRHIHGALYADKHAIKRDEMYFYSVETGEFRDMMVISPVALVAERLRGALADEDRSLSPEHRAAWLLVACASTVADKGDSHVSR